MFDLEAYVLCCLLENDEASIVGWWNRTHLESTVYIFTVDANLSVNPNLRDTFTGTVLKKKYFLEQS